MQTTIDPAPSHHRPGLDRTHVSTDGPAGARPAGNRRALPCRVQDPDLWFAESPAQLEQAKSLCVECPVRATCLAVALDRAGKRLFDRALPNDERRLRAVLDQLSTHGTVLLVVDQPSTIGALPVAVAQACGALVFASPGCRSAMRRIANPGR